jgi:hypothetical protein
MLDPKTAGALRVFFAQYGVFLLLPVIFFAGPAILAIMDPIVSALIGLPVG